MNVVTLILRWPGILISVLFMVAVLTACGDSGGSAPQTTPADSSLARSDSAGSTSLDDYIAWCSEEAQESLDDSEEYTYEEVTIFYGKQIEIMESVAPPVEVADWHNKGLAGWKAVKKALDAEPEDAIFNPFILFADSEVVSRFEEVEEALNDMSASAREQLVAGGCFDEGADSLGPIPKKEMGSLATCEPQRRDEAALVALYNATDGPNWRNNTNWLTDAPLSDWAGISTTRITVNERVVGECVTRLSLGNNQLSGEIPAELGNLLNLGVLKLGYNQLSGEIPAGLGNLLNLQRLDLGYNQLSGEIPAGLGNLTSLNLKGNQLSGEIPPELGHIRYIYLDGNQLSGRVLRPNGTNPQYAWDGSTIRVSWDEVPGADYYNVYYDDFSGGACLLRSDGSPSFCDELATNVVGTTYVHTDPDSDKNYYWVFACNSNGCSDTDSPNPATPIGTPPNAPTNARYALEGSTIRVSWDAADGADYYTVHYDLFPDSNCSRGWGFCRELATNVVGTTYVHTSPNRNRDDNYYWVVSCNSSRCSDIDSKNPAKPE